MVGVNMLWVSTYVRVTLQFLLYRQLSCFKPPKNEKSIIIFFFIYLFIYFLFFMLFLLSLLLSLLWFLLLFFSFFYIFIILFHFTPNLGLGTQQFTVLALHDRWVELSPRANLRHFPSLARGYLLWFYFNGFIHYAGTLNGDCIDLIKCCDLMFKFFI